MPGSGAATTFVAVSRALSRSSFADRTLRVLQRGGWGNPDVFLVESANGPVVVKDYAPRSAWVRWLLGRWITARELRAYRALEGLPAVPRLLGGIDPLAFAVEYRPGTRMSRLLADSISPAFLGELADAIDAMHARGVAHLDLRHRSNVLVDEQGRPVLIDFASAICLRPGSLMARLLMPVLGWLDRRAFEKWRVRLSSQRSGGSRAGGGPGGGASEGERGAKRPT